MGDVEQNRSGYRISMDADAMDLDAIHAYLSGSYWSEGIPRDVVARAIGGSLCFGLFDHERQVGFARVVTDRATFAYLCDVYVLEGHRGRGLAAWLMEAVREVRVCTFGAARNLHGDQSPGDLLAQANRELLETMTAASYDGWASRVWPDGGVVVITKDQMVAPLLLVG